jgi:hypothetical protein
VKHALYVAVALLSGCALFYPIGEKTDSNGGASAGAAGATLSDGGGRETSSDHAATGCATDQECRGDGDGAPVICRLTDNTCQTLETEECRVVYPRTWDDPHAVILGAYTLLPPANPEDFDLVWNYELAVQEFDNRGGLPDTNGAMHTLVTVICNNDPAVVAMDSEFLSRSLDHLTDVVGVAAIVADLPPKDLIDAFERTRDKGKDVFFLSPGPANNALASLDDAGRVWSMLGLAVDLAPAYKALLKRIESYIRAIDPTVGMLRVALVKSSDPGEPRHEQLGELIDALTQTSPDNPNRLEFNGLDLTKNQEQGYYKEFLVDSQSPAATGQAILDNFQAHVVISMTGPAFTHFDPVATLDGVADTIESLQTGDRKYPFFMLSPVNASAWSDVVRTIMSIGQTYPDVHRRFLGIDVATADDLTLYNDYRYRLLAVHSSARERTENYYDPVYYMAYAMTRAGVGRPLSGGDVLAGMQNTIGGTRYDVGPGPMAAVFSAIRQKEPVLLVGTMGEPNFNQQTGTRVNRAALYCFPFSSQEPLQQVQVYEGGTWVGDFGCYQGF